MEPQQTPQHDTTSTFLTVIATALAVVLVSVTYHYTMTPQVSATDYVIEAENSLTIGNYNIDRAIAYYEQALSVEPTHQKALYALSRAYYIEGRYDDAFRTIAAYRESYPEDARINYIAGLANAYAGHYDASLAAFTAFTDSGLATWPAYLDTAWVHFKRNDYESARSALEYAVETFGSNAWLATSLGAVHIALGDTDAAREELVRADAHMTTLTESDWRANYSMNDPARIAEEMQQMRDVIAFNLALADGGTQALTQAQIIDMLDVPFADLSNKGIAHGIVVSACGDSCTTTQCISAANVCGQVNTGTQSSCGGGCSAGVPANPSGACSLATACGVDATGFNGCNGQCNITRFPFCTSTENPDGDGEIEWIEIDNPDGSGGELGATDIACEIFASPTLVSAGTQSVIRWLSTETDSAEVVANLNDDNWTGRFGEQLTSEITEPTTYTLTCVGYDGTTVTDTVTVEIVPEWQEF